jgi:hypothetical protein
LSFRAVGAAAGASGVERAGGRCEFLAAESTSAPQNDVLAVFGRVDLGELDERRARGGDRIDRVVGDVPAADRSAGEGFQVAVRRAPLAARLEP